MKSKATAFKSLLPVIREFLKALRHRHTYSIRKNWYCLFGILWGLPIPIVTIGIDLYSGGLSLTVPNIFNRIISHPIHIFFLIHPVIFAIVFGAMGTVRYHKDREIQEFGESLIQMNEELRRINERLKELDELKSNFLSMVSHELRTPLTSILGYISFLKSKKAGPLTDAQWESICISEDEAIHLNYLIEELLDLTKIEAGVLKVNLQRVDLGHIVVKTMHVLRPVADKKRVIIENNLPRELPFILADDGRIFQVITNIIENAIKFNKTGGKVTVSSVNNSESDTVKLCITDTGMGIEQDNLDKIFDKFYQVDSQGNRRHGGCGLGLAISKRIIELHKGTIWVESTIGSGSSFFIEIKKSRT